MYFDIPHRAMFLDLTYYACPFRVQQIQNQTLLLTTLRMLVVKYYVSARQLFVNSLKLTIKVGKSITKRRHEFGGKNQSVRSRLSGYILSPINGILFSTSYSSQSVLKEVLKET